LVSCSTNWVTKALSIRSAAKQVPLPVLRDLVYQFQQVIESRKGEQVEQMAKDLAQQGISAEELLAYLNK
jgi:uncharacterized membrane protein affecting hemolysin expression